MLKPAILYADLLQGRFVESIFQDRFKFYFGSSGIDYFIPIYQNTGEMLQFVSLNEQSEVIGYFGARINRETDAAYDLVIINFGEVTPTFAADLKEFYVYLFVRFGAKKATWWVIVGNPAEKMYDRLVRKYGGRIVGTFKNEAKLFDGKLYDVKWYEVLREEIHSDGGVING